MDKKTYELIKKKHGGYASWAIWAIPEVWEGAGSRANMNDVSFFEDDQILTKLNPNIVLVALNFSIPVKFEKPFQNFHGGARARDYLIRLILKDTLFWGAYMTDIIKHTPNKKSEKATLVFATPILSGFWNMLNNPTESKIIIPHIAKFFKFISYINRYFLNFNKYN